MSETSQIRVLLVDDHAMVRRGLTSFLSVYDDLELVGEASDGLQAVQMCAQTQPDVILMDLIMPDMGGVAAIHTIHQQYPEVHIIALTNFEEDDLVHAALEAGAIGYLLKDISADDLADAIRAANAGQSMLASKAAQALIRAINQPLTPGHDLTPRELEVLKLIADGLRDSEIAEQLTISVSTVKFHVKNILSKLGASSRTEAATLAVRHNLLE